MKTAVVGAGVFGVTAALTLSRRGHLVELFDPGPIPHPLAASTDLSKVVRMAYGPDETYCAIMERAREGWLAWNAAWTAAGTGPLYHETGVLMACREPMQAGGFEFESLRVLERRGAGPERLDGAAIRRRFPVWSTGRYVDGFLHAAGGYAESGRVVAALVAQAAASGVSVRTGRRITAVVESGSRVTGVRDDAGTTHSADRVVLAAGAWTAKLAGLSDTIRSTGHPVFLLRPKQPELFQAARFPVFTADIARTGYYGFPLHQDGVVKIGNHGPGLPIDPDAPRVVPPVAIERMKDFLAETFPALVDAELVSTRLCLYADSQDEDFWIARDPRRPELTVATGDSGHGFKFAPVLGDIIADVVEEKQNALLDKFRWRPEVRLARGREAARWHGEEGV